MESYFCVLFLWRSFPYSLNKLNKWRLCRLLVKVFCLKNRNITLFWNRNGMRLHVILFFLFFLVSKRDCHGTGTNRWVSIRMLAGHGVKAARDVKGKDFLLDQKGLQESGGVSKEAAPIQMLQGRRMAFLKCPSLTEVRIIKSSKTSWTCVSYVIWEF